MNGAERIIQKIVNAVRAEQPQAAPVNVPSLGRIELESLYASQWEAIEAAERHLERMQQSNRRAYHLGCE